MTKRDLVVASTRHHYARLLKYYPRRQCSPSLIKSRIFSHTTKFTYSTYFLSFWNSLCVYMQGILGCLLGFWPLGQNPGGAIKKNGFPINSHKVFLVINEILLINSYKCIIYAEVLKMLFTQSSGRYLITYEYYVNCRHTNEMKVW